MKKANKRAVDKVFGADGGNIKEAFDPRPIDTLLRKNGYRIWERKRGQEPVWADSHMILYKQSDILLRLEPKQVEDAQLQADLRGQVDT